MPTLRFDGLTKRVACGACIKGHRSSKCQHYGRPLIEIRRSGRPMINCPHLKDSTPCNCNSEQVYVVVGHSPQYDGPEGEITNVQLAPQMVEYPKSRAKRLKSESNTANNATSNADGKDSEPQPCEHPQTPNNKDKAETNGIAAEQTSPGHEDSKLTLRLGLMGVGGANAGPDPIGWDGDWPSRDEHGSESTAAAEKSKKEQSTTKQCCQKSQKHFREQDPPKADGGKKCGCSSNDVEMLDRVSGDHAGSAFPKNQLVPRKRTTCDSTDIEFDKDFIASHSNEGHSSRSASPFSLPNFNYLTPIPASRTMDSTQEGQASNNIDTAVTHPAFYNTPRYVTATDGLSNISTPAVGDGCTCQPEECCCLNCAQHINNPQQQKYFTYIWDLQATPAYIAEEERINQSTAEQESNMEQAVHPHSVYSNFAPVRNDSYDSSRTQSEDYSYASSNSFSHAPSLDFSHTSSIDWATTPSELLSTRSNQSSNPFDANNSTSAPAHPYTSYAARNADIDIAGKMRRMANAAFPQTWVRVAATTDHQELVLRPIPNTDGVVLDPEHMQDMCIRLYYEGLVLEDGLRHQAQVVHGRLQPVKRDVLTGEWQYILAVPASKNGQATVQKVETGLFKFAPSLNDPGIDRKMAEMLHRSS